MGVPLEAKDLIANAYVTIGNARNTAEILGCSHTAVLDAVRSQPDGLASAKKALASKWAVASEQVLEDCVAGRHGDFKSKAEAWTAAAIAADKAAKLTEGPQVAIQINTLGDAIGALDDLLSVRTPQPVVVSQSAHDISQSDSTQNSSK